jgi:APA family basic amino acid/polyamine antiporter
LRDHDPFDAVVAGARFIDFRNQVSFEEVVSSAARSLAGQVRVDAEKLKKLFMEGTQIGATPVSHGAALPHLRLPEIEHSELVIIRCNTGTLIDITSEYGTEQADNTVIHAFFFLASPEENPGQHLRILAQIASHVDDDVFMERWREASNEQEIKELLLRDDRYISLILNSDSKTSRFIGKTLEQLELPAGCLVAIIHRRGEIIIPRGVTVLEEFDSLTIIGYPQGIEELYQTYFEE